MRVVIIQDQFALADFLAGLLQAREEAIELEVIDWQDAKALEVLTQADVIMAALFPMPWHSSQEFNCYSSLLQRLSALAKSQAIPFFAFSSSAVFDGKRIAYHENDKPCPSNAYGQWFVQQEEALSGLEKRIIIRTAWLYSPVGQNFLTASIKNASQHQLIRVNSAGKACPTAVQDLARVVLAIILQLRWGAQNWGVFHYVASDTALGFQFIEAILTQAAKFDEKIDAKQVIFEHAQDVSDHFYFSPVVLKCHRLLECFGIHQRPWRGLMPAAVKDYCQKDK